MRKIIIISALLCTLLITPIFVSAQAAPTQSQLMQELIQTLTQLIAQLQQQIQQILAQQQSQSNTLNQIAQNTMPATSPTSVPASQPTSVAVTTTPTQSQTSTPVTDYSQYTPTYFYNFAGDPPAYIGTNIEVKGVINNEFFASGDAGGSSNYIGIADPNARSFNTVMLNISSNANYQKAVSALQYEDLISAYGTSAPSENITVAGQQELVPVINVTRLDVIGACGGSGCGESGSVTTIFP
jgi:hypothetical protein